MRLLWNWFSQSKINPNVTPTWNYFEIGPEFIYIRDRYGIDQRRIMN